MRRVQMAPSCHARWWRVMYPVHSGTTPFDTQHVRIAHWDTAEADVGIDVGDARAQDTRVITMLRVHNGWPGRQRPARTTSSSSSRLGSSFLHPSHPVVPPTVPPCVAFCDVLHDLWMLYDAVRVVVHGSFNRSAARSVGSWQQTAV